MGSLVVGSLVVGSLVVGSSVAGSLVVGSSVAGSFTVGSLVTGSAFLSPSLRIGRMCPGLTMSPFALARTSSSRRVGFSLEPERTSSSFPAASGLLM